MRKRWLGFGLALLIGISAVVSDFGLAVVSATEASSTTGNDAGAAPVQGGESAPPVYTTENNARFTVDGAERVVTENLNPNKYPADFSETQVECKGKMYKGLKADFADIQMICLLNQNTGAAAYYIYQDADQSVYPFIKIENGQDYIIAMPEFMSQDAQVPGGYVKTELEFEKGKAEVYQSEEKPGAYLIYAMNNTGEKNWYEYNAQEKTYQAYAPEGKADESVKAGAADENTDDAAFLSKQYEEIKQELKEIKSRYHMIIAVMVIVIAILLFLLVNTLLKNRQEGEDYDMEEGPEEDFYGSSMDFSQDSEEEEFFGEFEEEPLPKPPVKESKKEFLKKEKAKEEILEEDFLEEVRDEQKKTAEKKYENDLEILDLNDL